MTNHVANLKFTRSGLAYSVAGDGLSAVFIHGWAMSGAVWKKQIKYFSTAGWRAAAIDLRGHGASRGEGPFTVSGYAQDVKELVEELRRTGMEKPVLIGWSMGAMALIYLAGNYPEDASCLVLVGGTPRFTTSNGYPFGLPSKEVKGMRAKVKRDLSQALVDFRGSMTFNLDDEDRRLVMEHPIPAREVALSGVEELLNLDLRDRLESVKLPVLLIHGDRDRVCPVGASIYMHERIKGSELFVVEKSGHIPFITHEEIFNKKVEAFGRRFY